MSTSRPPAPESGDANALQRLVLEHAALGGSQVANLTFLDGLSSGRLDRRQLLRWIDERYRSEPGIRSTVLGQLERLVVADYRPLIPWRSDDEITEECLLRVAELDNRPTSIEGQWGCDAAGVFLDLTVVVSALMGAAEYHLYTFIWEREGCAFPVSAPPWPEARQALVVGTRLSERLHVPLLFPADVRDGVSS